MPRDYNSDIYNSHIVPTPILFLVIQALIIILAAAVVGLTAYGLSFDNGSDGNSFAEVIVCLHRTYMILLTQIVLGHCDHCNRYPRLCHYLAYAQILPSFLRAS